MRSIKKGLAASSIYWKLNFSQKHFTRAGGKEYGYRDRAKYVTSRYKDKTGKWVERAKDKRGNNTLPLVWTGTLRAMVLGQFPQPRIKDDGTRITSGLTLEVPKYAFYTKTKKGDPIPRMFEELITTSAKELPKLNEAIALGFSKEIRGPGKPKTVRIA